MNKITKVFILLLVFFNQLLAGPVDVKRAKAFASQFIEVEQEAFRAESSSLASAPAYYVFKGKGDKGFVIVSGEDRLPLLIGYADKGEINEKDLPEQLKYLLELYTKQVQSIRQTADKGSFRSQKVFMQKPNVIVEPLTKSKWGQQEPFNELCPEISDGQRAVTGCVATAVSQIMYYHKWPNQGKGSHSYVPKNYGKTWSADFSQHTYQWDLMKDEYKMKWVPIPEKPGYMRQKLVYTTEEGNAIGRLFSDVGISVDMDYGIGSSGAVTQRAVGALRKYFSYTARNLDRKEAEGNAFLNTIKSELDARRPLILSGQGSGGGHAWVIDGYDENDYLHCNWGWTGTSNGFFSLNFMSPSALGTGGGSGGYNGGQSILLAAPLKGGDSDVEMKEIALAFGEDGGISLEQPYGSDKSSSFLFKFSAFFNYSEDAFNSKVAIGIYNADKTFISIIEEEDVKIKGSDGGMYSGRGAYLYNNLANYQDGTYHLRPLFKPNGSNNWEFIKRGNTLKIEIKNGQVSVKGDSKELRIKFASEPREDVQVYTTTTGVSMLEIENLSSQYIESNLGLKLTNLATNRTYTKKLDPIRLAAESKSVIYAHYDIKDLNLTSGEYSVSFELYFVKKTNGSTRVISQEIENPFGPYQIKVLDAAKLPVLLCQEFNVMQGDKEISTYHLNPQNVSKPFKFMAKILNSGTKAFNGKLTYRLRNLANQEITPLGEVTNLSITAGNTVEFAQTSIETNMKKLQFKDGDYRIELIASSENTEINVWNAGLNTYNFMTKGLEHIQPQKFKVSLAKQEAGGRLCFHSPIESRKFEHSFTEDTEVVLISETSKGYELNKVLVNGVNIYQKGKAIKFKLSKDSKVEVTYQKKMIALTEPNASNGSITYVDHKVGDKVAYGEKVKVQVQVPEGYELATLTHNGTDIKGTKEFVVGDSNDIVVTFAKKMIALTEPNASNGSVTYVGHQVGDKVAYGEKVKLQVQVPEGYELATLTHNGTDIKGTKEFVVGDSNDIVATFTKVTAVDELNTVSVQVFPNPASDYIQLKGFVMNEEVRLITINGKLVRRLSVDMTGAAKVNVSDLARGLYFVWSRSSVTKLELR